MMVAERLATVTSKRPSLSHPCLSGGGAIARHLVHLSSLHAVLYQGDLR
jgi:hypothetical protein